MLEVGLTDNHPSLIENLSLRKAFKDLLNDLDHPKLLSHSPLFKTSLLDLDKILTSDKKLEHAKFMFDEPFQKNNTVQEFQNGKFDLINLQVNSQQIFANYQMDQFFNNIQNIGTIKPTNYILGKKHMQKKKLKLNKYVDQFFNQNQSDQQTYKQYLLKELIK